MSHLTTPKNAFPFEHTYAEELPGAYAEVVLPGSPEAKLVVFNHPLAERLGLDVSDAVMADVVAGNAIPDSARPIALAYAGHQFGHLSPQLGDGRAALLGEIVDPEGSRWDLQLKGSGRTAFSRRGDGRATLGPILREFLVAEAMHHLGVKTSRVLAAVTTGDMVQRETLLPGAILLRVASSHIRVGTFELFGLRRDEDTLRRLTDYSLRRHYPSRADTDNSALALLNAVTEAQAKLVAQWMQVGFVHGVMNTDNFTIAGETIDYGPCAFMDAYDPAAVYSSIDHAGRYAYGNQPPIAGWNLARLAEALLPLIDADAERAVEMATHAVRRFQPAFDAEMSRGMAAKFGLAEPNADDLALIEDMLKSLHENKRDFTNSFRALSASLRKPSVASSDVYARWRKRVLESGSPTEIADAMDRINPLYIARNHKVEEALAAAHEGDMTPFHTLLDILRSPYTPHDVPQSFARPADDSFGPYKTFCGT